MFADTRARICGTALALTLASSALLAPSTARAAVGDLVCQGTQKTTFNPPLTNATTTTEVKVRETWSTCADPVGITSGRGSLQVTVPSSCQSLGFGPPSTVEYKWNNGQKSTVHWTSVVVTRLTSTSEVVKTGSVTDGYGKNDTATETITLVNPSPLACAGSGVPSVEGPTTLTFQ
ncbi:hypothetical protein [Streptomyces telluris]|uniref:Ig-like domain-containing protein n=1 Tax=Streptomyces telluris TaxID=2720021 RepID=A0A9X2LL00_9ACTN|nr:hypothetical protein [Streptomyces telluris]MCQ8773123.1 hypothetical protein [Streptomyces telluris]NJP82174.1 hypothetical protein [Streptomyces telluris]